MQEAVERSSCQMCGTCCRKNSPVLHVHDLELIRNKILVPENLVLLRKGEPAMDNVLGRPVLLDRELIKIKGTSKDSWSCVFHNASTRLCIIHRDRPFQCRVLECWDTSEIAGVYQQDTLARDNIFAQGSAMKELFDMHEDKCSVTELAGLVQIDFDQPGLSRAEISCMLDHDQWFRKELAVRAGISEEAMDYYFGRPLAVILSSIRQFITRYGKCSPSRPDALPNEPKKVALRYQT